MNPWETKMTNLLQETIKAIYASGHTLQDILFIGSIDSRHCCTWREFEALADIEYDEGFGRQNVARDLEIVFADCARLKRADYDGEESWKLIKTFRMPADVHPISALVRGDPEKNSAYAKTLKELNP